MHDLRINKRFNVLILFVLLTASLVLRPEKTSAQEGNDSVVRYVNAMEYAFMMHEETEWLLKAGLILSNDDMNMNPFKFAFEHRISGSFTANAAIDHSRINLPGENEYFLPVDFSLESRWYYRLKKRMREEGVAASMSDNYLALGTAYTYLLNYNNVDVQVDYHYLSLYARWGIQRRYLKYGHVDLGIRAGVMSPLDDDFSPSLVLNTYVEMGLGFARDKYRLDREKLCPFIKCYDADLFIIKTNLSDFINIGYFTSDKWIEFSPQVAFEHKIATSPFSLNAELKGTVGYSESNSDEQSYINRYWIAGLTLEGRYYYNLRKSIRNGRSGNGLSANYVVAGGGYYFVDDEKDKIILETGPQLYIGTGWQRLISRHLYFDIQVGVNYYFEPNRFQNLFEPYEKLGLGCRF